MPKYETVFVCSECQAQTPRWQGKCFKCGAFGSLSKVKIPRKSSSVSANKNRLLEQTPALLLSQIKTAHLARIRTRIGEFDRVLRGGFVPGQVVLLGGEPGIGKSTLLLQVAAQVKSRARDLPSKTSSDSQNQKPSLALYASAEESAFQIKSRAKRLGLKATNLQVLAETDIDQILGSASSLLQNLNLLILDSIQTVYTTDIDSNPGSVAQVQGCTRKLVDFAKRGNIPIMIVGHVTKSGMLAGPKQLEHLVDTVLYLEGERYRNFRLLRSLKNRFGPVNEVGVFKMTECGLSQIENPTQEVLADRHVGVPGSVLTVSLEGQRPLVLEIQALTSPSYYGYPRRTATGISRNRLEMLLAVLQNRARLHFGSVDVYVNVSGGFSIREPASDLAVALALASSLKNKAVQDNLVAVGELGLLGEIKEVNRLDDRIREAQRLGFSKIMSTENSRTISTAIRKALLQS